MYTALSAAQSGKLAGGTAASFGAKVDGVGYGKWSSRVSASIKSKVAARDWPTAYK